MNNNQNTYQQQMGAPTGAPMMPPPPMRQSMAARARRLRKLENNLFPRWLTQYSIVAYLLALMAVTFMYSSHSLPWYYMLSGVIAVTVFFLYGSHLAEKTFVVKMNKGVRFEKQIFLVSFVLCVVWMSLIYALFMQNYGDAFGFESGDAFYYDELGQFTANMMERSDYHFYDAISQWSGNSNIDDMGYGIYVGVVYLLTDHSIIAVRLLKCLWAALTVVLIYRLAKRNFGDQTARIAAIFCALWPNFWYYSGTHLKETEMTFLAVLFIEQADQMLRSRQFTAWKVIPVLLIAAAMFTFRTPLGMIALLALVFSVVMSSTKVVSWGKRIIIGVLAVVLIGIVAGERIQERAEYLYERVQSNEQQKNMEWRATKKEGNAFAKYASAAVFAPMIFTIPFPTMSVAADQQDLQQLLNGGNFIKNVMSAFNILAVIVLLLSGKWRELILSLSFMLGYLVVLTMSVFAQSGRFHMPVMPLEFMFAAYGLSIVVTKKKYKRWFMYWCVIMFVAAIAWNWFKLAGRGLV